MSTSRLFSFTQHWQQVCFLAALMLVLSVSGDCSSEKVLFNGTTLDGWAHTGPGYFALDRGEKTLAAMGGMGMLFYYDQQFADFELTLEYKTTREDSNSGVFVRFPNLPKKDRPAEGGKELQGPWGAVNEGYEVQICDSADGSSATGGLYSFFGASKRNGKPMGEWNSMKVRVEGQRYQVWINGEQVGDYTGNRALKGYIGVQNHAHDGEVHFRNIRITELEKK